MAYQQAAQYAKDRLQGRSPRGPQNENGVADSLLAHPDVPDAVYQRAYNEAGRAFGLFVGLQLDLANHADDPVAKQLVDLLTPVAKAFLSDKGLREQFLRNRYSGATVTLKSGASSKSSETLGLHKFMKELTEFRRLIWWLEKSSKMEVEQFNLSWNM